MMASNAEEEPFSIMESNLNGFVCLSILRKRVSVMVLVEGRQQGVCGGQHRVYRRAAS